MAKKCTCPNTDIHDLSGCAYEYQTSKARKEYPSPSNKRSSLGKRTSEGYKGEPDEIVEVRGD